MVKKSLGNKTEKKNCPRCHGTGKMPNNGKNRARTRSNEPSKTIDCDLCRGRGKY